MVQYRKTNYVVEADIRGFFDNVDHEWLMKMLSHDIADRRFLEIIEKFLKAGIMEDGKFLDSERGTPQGNGASPILANIYLHYVLDLSLIHIFQGYCSMNMDGISVITDFVGGIQLTIPDDSLADVNPEYKKGAVVDITGETAEQFVRYRDIDKTQSALVRQERQKTFLQALVQKAQEKAGEDAGFVTGLYDSVKSYTVTNMGNDIFAKLLAEMCIRDSAGTGWNPRREENPRHLQRRTPALH